MRSQLDGTSGTIKAVLSCPMAELVTASDCYLKHIGRS